MLPVLVLAFVVAVKVFKKTTPNGKVTVYLGKRDFIDHLDHVDPIDGIVVVENDYLKGRKIYGQGSINQLVNRRQLCIPPIREDQVVASLLGGSLSGGIAAMLDTLGQDILCLKVTTTYRYGREEDEVMGVKFSKEMTLAKEQIVPVPDEKRELTPVQEKLIKKLGPNAYPFTFYFPPSAPSSVTLQPGDDDQGKPLGVEYAVRTYVADNPDDRGHKRSALQYAPLTRGRRLPSSLVSKGFTFSHGKLSLEVTLDREIYYHGEKVAASLTVNNNSRKAVRNIKVFVIQHCEVTMVNAQYSRPVASLETREGCPITPGAAFTKVFYLVPLASSNKDRRGIALDGHLKDEDVNLASSTLVQEGKAPNEAMGIVISYSVRVKLNCGTLGGELVTDVPFKLLHPAGGSGSGTQQEKPTGGLKKSKSMERSRYENSCYADDDEDNIVFEDFARLRLNEPDE